MDETIEEKRARVLERFRRLSEWRWKALAVVYANDRTLGAILGRAGRDLKVTHGEFAATVFQAAGSDLILLANDIQGGFCDHLLDEMDAELSKSIDGIKKEEEKRKEAK